MPTHKTTHEPGHNDYRVIVKVYGAKKTQRFYYATEQIANRFFEAAMTLSTTQHAAVFHYDTSIQPWRWMELKSYCSGVK